MGGPNEDRVRDPSSRVDETRALTPSTSWHWATSHVVGGMLFKIGALLVSALVVLLLWLAGVLGSGSPERLFWFMAVLFFAAMTVFLSPANVREYRAAKRREVQAKQTRNDEPWTNLSKELRALMDPTYHDLFLNKTDSGGNPVGLRKVFSSLLKESLSSTNSNEAAAAVGFQCALDAWPGTDTYKEFRRATSDLDQPITKEQFVRIHKLFQDALVHAKQLTSWVALWQGLFLGFKQSQAEMWYRNFLTDDARPFLADAKRLQRRIQIDMHVSDTILADDFTFPTKEEVPRHGRAHISEK